MGTRSNTLVMDDKDTILVNMFNMWDGYVTGYGDDLAKFLSRIELINGITGKKPQEDKIYANGAGCLAAQLVSYFKTNVGSIYLESADNIYDEYVYKIQVNSLTINIQVLHYGELKFEGDVEEFVNYCDNYNDEDEDEGVE